MKVSIDGKKMNADRICCTYNINWQIFLAKCGVIFNYLRNQHGVMDDATKQAIMDQDSNCMHIYMTKVDGLNMMWEH